MPFPTVNAVLQVAYSETRNMSKTAVAERGSPEMLEAISFVSLSEIFAIALRLFGPRSLNCLQLCYGRSGLVRLADDNQIGQDS